MSNTIQIELDTLLPEVVDAHDACLVRLVSTLESHNGIDGVHVLQGAAHRPHKLCIHHDPEELPVEDVRELTTVLSETLRLRFGHMSARVDSPAVACETVERLRRLTGVRSVESAADGGLHIEYNRDRTNEAEIRSALGAIGSKEDRV